MTLVLVTKNTPPLKIREAFQAGASDFGENRVQELLSKKTELDRAIRWHFVGRLQTNKVKSVIGEIALLHSLDRPALAQEIQRQAERKGLLVEALMQINVTGEETKAGFRPDEAAEAIRSICQMDHIRLRGLMTIGPTPPAETEFLGVPPAPSECFRRLRVLRDDLQNKFPEADLRHLSMGMSADFESAIEEGATIVRIGTAVFGEKK